MRPTGIKKGVSRARVTQILGLLRLSQEAIEVLLDLGDPLSGRIITERQLRSLTGLPPDEQGNAVGEMVGHQQTQDCR